MNPILKQMKERRLALGLKQNDMPLRIGISRQQYHRIESKGNPSLSTLELIATGLKSKLMLIPQEKMDAVKKVLEKSTTENPSQKGNNHTHSLSDNPWQDISEDEE